MFGAIYTLFTSIGLLVKASKEADENEKCRSLFRNKDGLTYIDTKGNTRLLSNNDLVFYTHDKNGDYVLENVSGYIYKNFSKEQRIAKQKELKLEAINNEDSTYCISEDNHKKDWICKGKRFIDMKTNDVYVIRCLNGKYYYMDINNGKIIRKTDWQIKKDQEVTTDYYSFDKGIDIEAFNKRQETIQDKTLLFRNYEYNSSCDYRK